MWNLETLGDRIRYVQYKLGGSPNLEKLSEVSPTQQSRLIRNEINSPGLKQITGIAKAGGVSLDWLVFGTGEAEEGSAERAGGYIALPFIDQDGKPPFMFEKEFLVSVLGVKTADGRMYLQTGDSMTPTIKQGDHVLINISRKDGDGVFLVRIDGRLFLQRLQYMPGAGVKIISDNGSYQSYTLQPEQVTVLGQMAWIGSR